MTSFVKHKDQYLKYVVDEMAKAHGHEVVCLPPYHCELNPIEMAWSQVKQFAKKNNTTFTIPGLQALVHDTFAEHDGVTLSSTLRKR